MTRCDVDSLEFAYLSALCAGVAKGVRESPSAPVGTDTNKLMALMDRHRVGPLICEALRRTDTALSQDQRDALAKSFRTQSLHGLMHVAQTVRLSRALDEAGVPHLVLKGAPLATDLFGDPTARLIRDIDILVAPETLAAAQLALEACGYRGRLPDQRAAADDVLLQRLGKDVSFISSDARTLVELHWRLSQVAVALPWTFAEIYRERRMVVVQGREIPTLSPERNLVYLCWHGAVSGWHRLKWLVDIGRIFTVAPPDRFEEAARLAREAGVESSLALAAALAQKLFGIPTPPAFANLSPASVLEPLVTFSLEQLGRPVQVTGGLAWHVRGLRHSLRLQRSLRYRLGAINTLMVARRDHEQLQLPAWAGALYYPLRPFLMGWRRIAGKGVGRNPPGRKS